MAKASIITIGDELLIGQVVDTNSSWMATELNKAGIRVVRRVAVGDDMASMHLALNQESEVADVILITGGLGPTADDITKPFLCEYFGGRLVMNEQALQHVKNLFSDIYKRPILDRNIRQAEVPDNCEVIINERGTAPAMWFNRNGKIYVSMPGVPHEMQGIMHKIIPMLKEKLSLESIYHRTLVTSGIGESMLAEKIMDFEKNLPGFIKLAYLPRYGMVRLRLSAYGNESSVASTLEQQFSRLQEEVKEYLVSAEDESMEVTLGKLLLGKKRKICTAESCTGGYISQLITSVPGASEYYEGCFVTYSYEAKENLLQVDHETILNKGAVSEEVVIKMAEGALQKIKADYVIAVSGIMGPGGGTADKPVGTVWVALGRAGRLKTYCFRFGFDRKRNIEMTAAHSMNMLRKYIMEEDL